MLLHVLIFCGLFLGPSLCFEPRLTNPQNRLGYQRRIPKEIVRTPTPQSSRRRQKKPSPTSLARNILPNYNISYFALKHNPGITTTVNTCNITGSFDIEIINPICKNPKFYIRLWNRNQVSFLNTTSSLKVYYVIYASSRGEEGASFVSVTMLYCDFKKNDIRQNLVFNELVNSPRIMKLEKPPSVNSDTEALCSGFSPERWTMTDLPVPAPGAMGMLLGLVRTEYSDRYIFQRNYDDLFSYKGLSDDCFIPPRRESLCTVGDSHARTLQVLLNSNLYKLSPCYNKHIAMNRIPFTDQDLHNKKEPCPLDNFRRLPYIKALYLEKFHEVDLSQCDDILITYGLWDLVYTVKRYYENYTMNSVESMFRTPIKHVVQGLSKLSNASRIYFLSTDYTPLRGLSFNKTKSLHLPVYIIPPLIDEFNDIILSEIHLLNDPKVQYLDLRDIIRPLWDSADDYNHYHGIVGKYMAKKVACSLFPLSDDNVTDA